VQLLQQENMQQLHQKLREVPENYKDRDMQGLLGQHEEEECLQEQQDGTKERYGVAGVTSNIQLFLHALGSFLLVLTPATLITLSRYTHKVWRKQGHWFRCN